MWLNYISFRIFLLDSLHFRPYTCKMLLNNLFICYLTSRFSIRKKARRRDGLMKMENFFISENCYGFSLFFSYFIELGITIDFTSSIIYALTLLLYFYYWHIGWRLRAKQKEAKYMKRWALTQLLYFKT